MWLAFTSNDLIASQAKEFNAFIQRAGCELDATNSTDSFTEGCVTSMRNV
jgi:hypothetical protein